MEALAGPVLAALPGGLTLTPPALVVLMLALAALGFQCMRHTAADLGIMAAGLCLFGLLLRDYTVAERLALAGAGGLLLWGGLVMQAWRLAFLDELTGIPGRRALENRVALGGQAAVAMVDIDHFKRFNDTWGHDAGDQVLRRVAALVAETAGGGKAYRYGGEEFAVLFPAGRPDRARAALEEMRKRVAERPFTLRASQRRTRRHRGTDGGRKQVRITVSIGLAEPRGNEPAEATMERADTALYRAKKLGRNRLERG
jgi:diguanylate cyclase (GGDEF)-like protein